MKGGLDQICGKTIEEVVVSQAGSNRRMQLFLIFPDGSNFEIYGDTLNWCRGLDKGDARRVQEISHANGGNTAVFRGPPHIAVVNSGMPAPSESQLERSLFQRLGFRTWIDWFVKLGFLIAAVGTAGLLLKNYLDLLVPIGMGMAFFPALTFVFLGILALAVYAVTLPVRLWCAMTLRRQEVRDPLGEKAMRARRVLDMIDKPSEVLFAWW